MEDEEQESSFSQKISVIRPFYEFWYTISRSVSFRGFFIFSFIVELICSIQFLLLPFYYHELNFSQSYQSFMKKVLFIVDPSLIITNYFSGLLPVFISLSIIIIIQILFAISINLQKNIPEIIVRVFKSYVRVFVRILSIPFINIFLKTSSCMFLDGSSFLKFGEKDEFELDNLKYGNCFDYPYYIFGITGLVFVIITCFFSQIHELLFADMLIDQKPRSLVSTGRINAMQRAGMFVSYISFWIFMSNKNSLHVTQYFYLVVSFIATIVPYFFTLLTVFIHDNFLFFLRTSVTSIVIGGIFGNFLTTFFPYDEETNTTDVTFLFILVPMIFCFFVNIILTGARLTCLVIRKTEWEKNRNFKKTFLMTKYEALRILSSKGKNQQEFMELYSYFNRNMFSHELIFKIFSIFQMISYRFDSKLIKKEVNRLENMPFGGRVLFIDSGFFLYYLVQRKKEIDFLGFKKTKISKEIRKINILEDEIIQTRKQICIQFLKNKEKYYNLTTLFSSIEEKERVVEKKFYKLLSKNRDDPTVLKSYGNYLYKNETNFVLAETYFQRAEEIEKRMSEEIENTDIDSDKVTKIELESDSDISVLTESASHSELIKIEEEEFRSQESLKNPISPSIISSGGSIKKQVSTAINNQKSNIVLFYKMLQFFMFCVLISGIVLITYEGNFVITSYSTRSTFMENMLKVKHLSCEIGEKFKKYQILNYSLSGDSNFEYSHKNQKELIDSYYYGVNKLYESKVAMDLFQENYIFDNFSKISNGDSDLEEVLNSSFIDSMYFFHKISLKLYYQILKKEKMDELSVKFSNFYIILDYFRYCFNDILNEYLEEVEKEDFRRNFMRLVFPVILLPILFYIIFHFILYLNEKKVLKELINKLPKKEIVKIFLKNKGSEEELLNNINYFDSNVFENNKFTFSINLKSAFSAVVLLLIVISYILFILLNMPSFKIVSNKILRTSKLVNLIECNYNQIYFWSMEICFQETNVTQSTHFIQRPDISMEESLFSLKSKMELLRNGNDDNDYLIFDTSTRLHELIYEKIVINSENETLDFSYRDDFSFKNDFYLCSNNFTNDCYSFIDLVVILENSVDGILDTIRNMNISIPEKKSLMNEYFLDIENIHSKNIFKGHLFAIKTGLSVLYDERKFPASFLFTFLFFFAIFFFTTFFLVGLCGYPKKYERYLKKIKGFVLFLSRSTLSTVNMRRGWKRGVINKQTAQSVNIKRKKGVFSKIFRNLENYSVVLFEKKGNICDINENACTMFNLRKEEFRTKKIWEIFDDSSDMRSWVDSSHRDTFSCNIKGKKYIVVQNERAKEWERNSLGSNSLRITGSVLEDLQKIDEQVEVMFNLRVSIVGINGSSEFLAWIRSTEHEEEQERKIHEEKLKSEELLKNILPESIAEKFMNNEDVGFRTYEEVSTVFIDIIGFTKFSSLYQPEFVIEILNSLFVGFDDLCDRRKIEKIKTIGDCYFACSGIPTPVENHIENIFLFSVDVLKFMFMFNFDNKIEFHVKIGIDSGRVIAGVIGKLKWCFDVWGKSVDNAEKLQTSGARDKIHVSERVYKKLKDFYKFEERMKEIKQDGEDEEIKTYIYNIENYFENQNGIKKGDGDDSGEFEKKKNKENKGDGDEFESRLSIVETSEEEIFEK